MNLKDLILNIVNDDTYNPMTSREMADYLKADKYTRQFIYDQINALDRENKIRISKKKRILPVSIEENSLLGKISLAQGGYGFFISDNKDFKDVFISKENLNKALDEDRV